jgi:hypothetical protein
MSNLTQHAKRELELAGYYKEDTLYGGMLPKAVLELMEVFSNQGHSGMSAGITISLFSKLARFKNIAPLTGEADEWNDTGESLNKSEPNGMYQNNRVSAVFKDGVDGQAYYIDAVVFQGEEEHDSFTGSVEGVTSKQFIKSFPFTPKTFRVDVYKDHDIDKYPENEVVEDGAGDKYVYRIKDPKQLEEVYNYYDKK